MASESSAKHNEQYLQSLAEGESIQNMNSVMIAFAVLVSGSIACTDDFLAA